MSCTLVMLCATACGDDQAAWCDDLRREEDLGALVSAVIAEDEQAAAEALERLRSLAEAAPAEIRGDMAAIAEVVDGAIEVRLSGDDVSAGELERRRDRVNQQLAEVTTHTAAVASWSEDHCGIVLD